MCLVESVGGREEKTYHHKFNFARGEAISVNLGRWQLGYLFKWQNNAKEAKHEKNLSRKRAAKKALNRNVWAFSKGSKTFQHFSHSNSSWTFQPSWLFKAHLKFVDTGKKNSPEFSVLCGLEADIATLDLERCLFNRRSTLVWHETLNATMRLGKEFHKRQLIVSPVFLQFMCWRKFTAWNFESHFIASKPDVVVILHTARQRIPRSAVCNSILERRCAGGVFARDTSRHFCMVVGVDEREMFKDVIIWCQRRSRCKGLEHCTQGTYLVKVEKRREKIQFITLAFATWLGFGFKGGSEASLATFILTGTRRWWSTNLLRLSVLFKVKRKVSIDKSFFFGNFMSDGMITWRFVKEAFIRWQLLECWMIRKIFRSFNYRLFFRK